MDAENLLISTVVREGDLTEVLHAKLTPEFFTDEEHRAVFVWLKEFWTEYGKVPGAKVLRDNFPTYRLVKGSEPLVVYLDAVRNRHKFGLLFETLATASAALEEDDVDGTLDALSAGVLRVHTEVTELRDTNIVETWEQRLENYAEWKKYGDRLRGIPSGFPTIDQALRGFQAEQLITFIGVPKVGKSTMLMRMALEAHNYGKTPLFLGFEMSNEEQEARHDSMVAGVSYGRLLAGRLTTDEEDELYYALRKRRSMHPFVLSSDPEGTTVSAVAAKMEQYLPDIVYVDGVYMMDDEEGEPKGSPQALTNITRSLKRLARRTETPIVISTQVLTWKMNRKRGVDMNAIGYSSSFAQDSDVILAVEHTDNEDEPIKKVSIVQARAAARRQVLITWDWDSGTFTELDDAEVAGQVGWGTSVEAEEDSVDDSEDSVDEDVDEGAGGGTKKVRRVKRA